MLYALRNRRQVRRSLRALDAYGYNPLTARAAFRQLRNRGVRRRAHLVPTRVAARAAR